MKLQDFFDQINAKAFKEGTENNYLYKVARYLILKSANIVLPRYLKRSKDTTTTNKREGIIVSLTSFPARINNIWITIKTLKRQTVLPEKIILWLSLKQFPNGVNDLPKSLRHEFCDIFEVRFVEEDLKPHKKYFYSFKEFPEKTIVTVDDDIFYNSRLIEYLLKQHDKYPNCVVCNRGYHIRKDSFYSSWTSVTKAESPSFGIFPTGVGGVLYPPYCYDEHIFDIETIMNTCLRADDLWLNFMCRFKGTKVVSTGLKFNPITISASQREALCKTNNGSASGNDSQIESIDKWANKELGVGYYIRVK